MERATQVMLVDDDDDVREIVEMTLADDPGWSVTAAASGPEALEAARRSPPDVILLDVMMPGMDGVRTLRELRARPETRMVPVIFLTARARKGDRERYMELGAIGVITKPFDPMGLSDSLRAILDRSRPQPAAVAPGEDSSRTAESYPVEPRV